MPKTPTLIRARRRGIPGWLHVESRRFLPLIAGAEEPDEAAKAEADKAAAEKAAADKAAADAEAAAKAAEADKDKLGEGGKAALDAERKRAKDAEKALKEAQARLKEIEDAKLSDTEKLQKQADEGKQAAATATDKLRKANLITALADKGMAGAKAKAAARLLDGVEYDDDDEPKNLDDAIKAAKAEYGDDLFKAVKPKAGNVNGGEGGDDDEKPSLTAEELQYAKSFGMTPEEYANYKSAQPKLPEKKTT